MNICFKYLYMYTFIIMVYKQTDRMSVAERQTDGQINRLTDRHKEKYFEEDKHNFFIIRTDKKTAEKKTDRQAAQRQVIIQPDNKTDRQEDRLSKRLTDRKDYRQARKKNSDRREQRWTSKQTDEIANRLDMKTFK